MNGAVARQDGVLKILDAAEGCFGARGYARASMADIARTAGVAKSLLHYHFHSKSHMFRAVQMRMFEGLMGDVRKAVAGGAPTIESIRKGLSQVFTELAADRHRARLLLELHSCEGGEEREQLNAFTSDLKGMLVEAIEDLVGQEGLVDGLTPDGLADVLLIVFRGTLVELSMDSGVGGVERTRRAFEQSITLIESALVRD